MLFKEVDFRQTRNNSRRTLGQYRRLERIAGRPAIDIRSPLMTDMPKGTAYGNRVEEAMLQRIDAETERDAIIAALMALSLNSRQVLYLCYCSIERYSNQGIARQLDYSVRQIERLKAEALIEFAESYRKGKLICYK